MSRVKFEAVFWDDRRHPTGLPWGFSFFCLFPQVREFSAAAHQRGEYSRLRVVKQWKVTGYLNQRIILAPDKSLRRVKLQDKHTDVCQSAPHQPSPLPSTYDANSRPDSTFGFTFFLYGIPIKGTIKYNQASSVFAADMATAPKQEGLPALLLTFHMSKRCTDSASASHQIENQITGCEWATVYTATPL